MLEQVRAHGNPVLLLHGGDAVSGSPVEYLKDGKRDYDRISTSGRRGIEVVDTMNRLGFDAMVLGKHEFDYGERWLEMQMEQARYVVVSV